jgi:hypothetical protein
MAAVFNLNEPAHVVHWHFFQMSTANVAVIVAMLVVFALALVIPFPGAGRRRLARERDPSAPPARGRLPIADGGVSAHIENEP